MIPQPLENEIRDQVRDTLGLLGIAVFRRNVMTISLSYRGKRRRIRCAASGQADLWGIDSTGRHWEVEVKRPGEFPRPNQLQWLRSMSQRGAVAFWVDSPAIAERVARAILDGGSIVWYDSGDFDVAFPDSNLWVVSWPLKFDRSQ